MPTPDITEGFTNVYSSIDRSIPAEKQDSTTIWGTLKDLFLEKFVVYSLKLVVWLMMAPALCAHIHCMNYSDQDAFSSYF